MVTNEGADQGFCLMGARTILKNVTALNKEIKKARNIEDIEVVHQMRVASRRIRADLPIFEPCFKTKQYKKWLSATKEVTKVLGEARDVDVQMEYLHLFLRSATPETIPGAEALFSLKQARRVELQKQLMVWLDELEKEGTLTDMRSRLERMVQQFEDRGTNVHTEASFVAGLKHASLRTNELLTLEGCVHTEEARTEHHAMRIAAKHLRYTLEAFRPLFDDELEVEIKVMKKLQDLLGEMHDCDLWIDTLPSLLSSIVAFSQLEEAAVRPGLEAVAQDRATARHQVYQRFVPTWDALRKDSFFEKTMEKLQTPLSTKELGGPVGEVVRRPDKLALISDVHGNIDALNAVMDEVTKEGVGTYLNMGDMVGFGANSEEVVQRLRSPHILSIAGNIDIKVLEFARASKKYKAQTVKRAVVGRAARDLSEKSLDFIASLPLEIRMNLSGRRVLMIHSSPADPEEHLSAETPDSRLEEIAKVANADIVLVGHSHKPLSRMVGGTLFVNPGSVGRPADHDPRASYAILDPTDFSVHLRRVNYDVEAAAKAIIKRGLPPQLADMIRQGTTGHEKHTTHE